ncbi:hypothetical protein BDV38DRAFT_290862 [Aspergillus pseudotamarii]|uniref:FTP domain-containing protein n=1 Tax=Aspergillus pseudotamarii TaxID=132259 RepID=A0A5N6T0Z5_ASPPS|nr:uncharacterized protein BDV38DRAFT_290862 [Aspergillus pseudotamarii]KAE8140147.1 hypothetical protein BDV38DRAFT_290862 [Aspergillus pseudotamarii]
MSFDRDPNVEVVRKCDGAVQSLDHAQQPWSPEAGLQGPSDPISAAHQYLLKVADDYRIPQDVLGETPSKLSDVASPTDAPFGLPVAQERPRYRSTAVIYQQTLGGLPVWDAKLNITVNEENQIVNSSSSIDTKASKPELPPDDAKYMQSDVTAEDLGQLLALPVSRGAIYFKPEQKKQQLLVYRYHKDDRQEISKHSAPTLILPEVPETIRDGQYYVVREVLFSLPLSGYGDLNWRAFVEVKTVSIVYLRALTAGLSGWVFARDPATKLGHNAPTTSGSIADLNLLRDKVFLPDTITTTPQALEGRYAAIRDFDLPTSLPPTTATGEFNDSVETDNFAAVNAYYHIAKLFRLLAELGFPIKTIFNNTQFPVPIDHRGFNNQVNAQAPGNAAGNGSGGFIFGRANANAQIGISADFRVAAHEFGHALLWDAINWPGFGFAHSPGDSLAAIYCDPGSDAQDRFNTFPWSVVRRRHDREVTDGWAWDGPQYRRDGPAFYLREQILSTTLFRLYRAIGGDAIGNLHKQNWASRYTLYLIIGGIATITTTASMPYQYVSAMILADNGTVLGYPGGAVRKIIRWSFEKQGLYHPLNTPSPGVMTRGPPPAVDVYINDGREGEYDYAPMPGNPPGVWNRQAPDGGLFNQAPIVGVPNYCYVAVKNRGTQDAQNVQVTVYESTIPEPTIWPTHFQVPGTVVQNIGPISGHGLHTAIAGPVQWTPQAGAAFDGYSLLAAVRANGDLSNIDISSGLQCALQPMDIENLVPFDNNLAMRQF